VLVQKKKKKKEKSSHPHIKSGSFVEILSTDTRRAAWRSARDAQMRAALRKLVTAFRIIPQRTEKFLCVAPQRVTVLKESQL
jgi:hypothetical protein